jgi:hypothetical protein
VSIERDGSRTQQGVARDPRQPRVGVDRQCGRVPWGRRAPHATGHRRVKPGSASSAAALVRNTPPDLHRPSGPGPAQSPAPVRRRGDRPPGVTGRLRLTRSRYEALNAPRNGRCDEYAALGALRDTRPGHDILESVFTAALRIPLIAICTSWSG